MIKSCHKINILNLVKRLIYYMLLKIFNIKKLIVKNSADYIEKDYFLIVINLIIKLFM